jgi:hypothetical protein
MINYSDKTLNKKEVEIRKRYQPTQFFYHYKIDSIKDLFEKFFASKKATKPAGCEYATCDSGRARSTIAAYQLCMHYFPKLTYKEMYRILQNYSKTSVYTNFFTCPTVGRAVYQGGIDFNKKVETYGW